MTDLVKRLRPNVFDGLTEPEKRQALNAAADRIEQLESALYWYVGHVTDCEGIDFLNRINADEETKRLGEFVKTFRAKLIPDPHSS